MSLHQNGDLFAAENCYIFAIALFDIHMGPMDAMTMTVYYYINNFLG